MIPVYALLVAMTLSACSGPSKISDDGFAVTRDEAVREVERYILEEYKGPALDLENARVKKNESKFILIVPPVDPRADSARFDVSQPYVKQVQYGSALTTFYFLVDVDELRVVDPELLYRLPEIDGGTRALGEKIVYPIIARKAGIEGTVVVRLVVSAEGLPTQVGIVKDIGATVGDEVVRATKLLHFRPGLDHKGPVDVEARLVVRFSMRRRY
ncbi:MAG: energy transducer TonB [Rhodothermales bacterium]